MTRQIAVKNLKTDLFCGGNMNCTFEVVTKNYVVVEHDKFTPNTKDLFGAPFRKFVKGHYTVKSYQNPNKNDVEFKPKLTITLERNLSYPTLTINASLPKWLYGENLMELTDATLYDLVEKMKKTLLTMGVDITTDELLNAKVRQAHFTKNIILPSGMLCHSAIKKIAQSMLSRLDGLTRDYYNDGSCLRFHCKSYEIVFYDKKKELSQRNIKHPLMNSKNEILRMEVRLKTGKALERKLAKAGIKMEKYSLKELYKESISKSILQYFWNKILDNMPKMDAPSSATDAFNKIEASISLSNMLEFAQFEQMIAENGKKEAVNILKSRNNTKNVTYFLKKYNQNCRVNRIAKPSEIVDEIARQIDAFILITPDSFTAIHETN